ncbi:NuoF family protein [Leptolyngbya sp. AN02str]|uniref:NuoF family protein n=1 Tax=Leptolyngbya sp. AN02str TaxID=3423363 RepID=UPI003D31AFAC
MDVSELLEIAQHERQTHKTVQIRCCVAAGCLAVNSLAVKEQLKAAVAEAGLEDSVQVYGVGCLRLCSQAPLVAVDTGGEAGMINAGVVDAGMINAGEMDRGPSAAPHTVLYEAVTPVQAHALVATLQTTSAPSQPAVGTQLQQGDLSHPFFTQQRPIVLEHVGVIDPERIESYIAAGGYQTLHHVLRNLSPDQVVSTITRSGLRGRGGAGYPTGLKWATVAKAIAERKFVVCNADEGDPGAFMDRSILEGDPHRVLEGMAIAAHAIGATQGYIYIRAEYPLAIHRLQIAIRQAQQRSLLGSQIFDSPFDFRIDLRTGAGAYVCGEETALMASIEGKRGIPSPRPPYPAEKGLWGFPTLINNVETLANIVPIMQHGAEWFANIGTPTSPGTKVFAIAGNLRNIGLIEVPMGTTLHHIVEDMGGGVPNGGRAKAVQTGGPSGGCIPASKFDTPVDYESLTQLGSMMGSGGMLVMDEHTNMAEIARYFMEFCRDESCGKCIPCRVGTVQLHQLLSRICEGQATLADIDVLEELCDMVKHTSLCGLGQSSPNPVFSTLRFFREDYLSRLRSS